MIIRRRGMPLVRGALIGGVAYSVGRHAAARTRPDVSRPGPAEAEPEAGADVTSRLTQLSDLLQHGILTQEEFVQAKARVLAG
jgi:hypothetical protein